MLHVYLPLSSIQLLALGYLFKELSNKLKAFY